MSNKNKKLIYGGKSLQKGGKLLVNLIEHAKRKNQDKRDGGGMDIGKTPNKKYGMVDNLKKKKD